jgi:LPS sulfotransferase NodH
MQKGQAPGFKRERIELERCSICMGKAVVKGLFFELVCTNCNGSGWVVWGSKLVLSSDELVTQLSFKLQDAQREISALKGSPAMSEPQSHYERSNRLGAGCTNYTGD